MTAAQYLTERGWTDNPDEAGWWVDPVRAFGSGDNPAHMSTEVALVVQRARDAAERRSIVATLMAGWIASGVNVHGSASVPSWIKFTADEILPHVVVVG